jgi:hypothetical protein
MPNGLQLEAHYSRVILGKFKAVCSNDFELCKVIGKGGFSKVYLGILLLFLCLIMHLENSSKKRHWVFVCYEGNEEGKSHYQ